MKKGFSLFSFDEHIDLREKFGLIKDAGYDGVEPVMSETGYLNDRLTAGEVREIGRMAADYGLEIPSVGVWSLWDNNLVSDRETVRNRALDIVKKQIEAARILGADTVLIVPGYTGCDFAKEPERIRYDVAYERCREALSRLSLVAEDADVHIGIENVWNRFLLSPVEVKGLLDTVGSSHVGMYFDVGNILYIGYPEDWIRILGSYIKKIHVCDYRRDQAGLGAFVDLLAGDVDYVEVAKALGDIGYDDYLTLEMLPNYKQFPDVALYANKRSLDFIADRLCGRGKEKE